MIISKFTGLMWELNVIIFVKVSYPTLYGWDVLSVLTGGRCHDRKPLEVAPDINILILPAIESRAEADGCSCRPQRPAFLLPLLVLTAATRWHVLLKSLRTSPGESGSSQKAKSWEPALVNTGGVCRTASSVVTKPLVRTGRTLELRKCKT